MTESEHYKLLIEDDVGHRRTVLLPRGELTIGRDPSNAVCLSDRNVSRHHARIVYSATGFYAEDLGSYTGLYINEARVIGQVDLKKDDILKIGDFTLHVQLADPADLKRDEPTQRMIMAEMVPVPTITTVVPPPPPIKEPQLGMAVPGLVPPVLAAASDEITGVIKLPKNKNLNQAQTPMLGAKLVGLSRQFSGKQFVLTQAETVIGRTKDNDMVLNHRSVSRHHAKIVITGSRYSLTDLGSANGTLINDEVYSQADLQRGDVLEFGHLKFRFVPPGEYDEASQDDTAVLGSRGPLALKRSKVKVVGRITFLTMVLLLLISLGLFESGWQWPQYAVASMQAMLANMGPQLAQMVSYVSRGGKLMDVSPVVAKTPAKSANAEQITLRLNDIQQALENKQWKRAQSIAQQVLAVDPLQTQAQQAIKLSELEARAQYSYDMAATAYARKQLADAYNLLQDIPKQSIYNVQATNLLSQVKPKLIGQRVADCQAALAQANWEEAELQIEEIEGLDANDPTLPKLREALSSSRKKRAADNSEQRKIIPRSKNKDLPGLKTTAAAVPETAPVKESAVAVDEVKQLYNDGAKALTAGQTQQAINHFSRCVLADKNYALCYRGLGIAYAKNGNGAKAAHFYRQYLETDPNAHDASQVRQLLQEYNANQ